MWAVTGMGLYIISYLGQATYDSVVLEVLRALKMGGELKSANLSDGFADIETGNVPIYLVTNDLRVGIRV